LDFSFSFFFFFYSLNNIILKLKAKDPAYFGKSVEFSPRSLFRAVLF
jgi:hypothetical protein